MTKFTIGAYVELQEELTLYAEMGMLPVKKLNGALTSIKNSISKVKNHLLSNPFQNEQDEIKFFKYEKPKFISEQIFLVEFTSIQIHKPPFDKDAIKSYFEKELKKVREFFNEYRFMYQYFQLDANDLDQQLFLRSATCPHLLLPQNIDSDPLFSTPGDYIFGKFIAFESLQEYLITELNDKKVAAVDVFTPTEKKTSCLKWTGESINLIEVIYGLWLTGQINHGNVSLIEITRWAESQFQIDLGRPHRRFKEIERRKRLSQTQFIDDMKDVLMKKINQLNK